MSHYETMFILHNRELSEGESEVTMEESVRQMVAKVGGEVHHVIVYLVEAAYVESMEQLQNEDAVQLNDL